MYKIGMIGDKDSIMGYKAAGLNVFYGDTAEQIKGLLDRLAKEQYAVIFITEKAMELVTDKITEFDDRLTPAVIPIPGISGNTGIGMRAVRRSVEKAVGAGILFNE